MSGVAVGTMALVIVLSVFNGLEDLIRGLNMNFDPELKIEALKGKSFVDICRAADQSVDK